MQYHPIIFILYIHVLVLSLGCRDSLKKFLLSVIVKRYYLLTDLFSSRSSYQSSYQKARPAARIFYVYSSAFGQKHSERENRNEHENDSQNYTALMSNARTTQQCG